VKRCEVERVDPEFENAFVGHGAREKSKPRPSKSKRVGHPERQNQSLRIDVLEWYYPTVMRLQKEDCGEGAPPADRMGDLAGQAADLAHQAGEAFK